VIPLSVQSHAGPEHAYAVGQALAELTRQNFLVLASGNLTHNLGDYHISASQSGESPAYVQVFADWIAQQMADGHVASLLNYRQASPAGQRAHPTEEHLLPLFVALGAAGEDATPSAFYRGTSDYVLAMDGYAFV
jgi:4,5-DOPA dioxygenase extradiol